MCSVNFTVELDFVVFIVWSGDGLDVSSEETFGSTVATTELDFTLAMTIVDPTLAATKVESTLAPTEVDDPSGLELSSV